MSSCHGSNRGRRSGPTTCAHFSSSSSSFSSSDCLLVNGTEEGPKKKKKNDTNDEVEDGPDESSILVSAWTDLERLLDRLRPFQKEAFEFAVRGTGGGTAGFGKRSKSGGRGITSGGGGGRDAREKCGGDGRLLLADEMGLGKTVTSLAIMAAYRSEWPLLILCPASLRHTWPSEIEKFLPSIPPSSIHVVSGFDDVDFSHTERKHNGAVQIVVATYSLLQNRSAAAKALDDFTFRCVIADESHNLRDKFSQRCKLAMPILQRARRLVLLSGTPALSRPVELWSQLHCLAPAQFGTYTAYTKRYCNARKGRFGWDVTGLSNADELHERIGRVMVRRLKSDVLSDLPSKQRSVVPVRVSKEHEGECRRLIQDLRLARMDESKLMMEEDAANAHFEARRLLMESYRIGGIAKAPAVAEFLLDYLSGLEQTQKALVFGHHREVLDVLERAVSKKYKGCGHVRIDGTVPPAERAVRVSNFQTNSKIRVAILSVTAAGVGLTLTAATSVVFAELHWTPGVLVQAEDRCHRIGQANSVNVVYCVCKDADVSVDMSLWEMLGKKVCNLGRVIDGDKSASMNAREVDNDSKLICGHDGGVSAEDELSAFFAESSPLNPSSNRPDEPVKGSIQSFFFKMSKDCKAEKAASCESKLEESALVTTTYPRVDETEKKIGEEEKKESRTCLKSDKSCRIFPPSTEMTWACHLCTYINTCVVDASQRRCEMCATPMRKTLCDTIVGGETGNTCARVGDSYGGEECGSEGNALVFNLVDDSFEDVSSYTKSRQWDEPDKKCVPKCLGTKTFVDEATTDKALVKTTSVPSDVRVICLDGAAGDTCTTSPPPLDSVRQNCTMPSPQGDQILSFAASKNSGRISIHSFATGRALNVNFDIKQILTDSAKDNLFESRTKRVRGEGVAPVSDVEFDMSCVLKIVQSIDCTLITCDSPLLGTMEQSLCQEICSFVRCYLSLRGVEKKVFMDAGRPTPHSRLVLAVAELMAQRPTKASFDRYGGGALDAAIKNARDGSVPTTEHDEAVLRGDACAWCGGGWPLPPTSTSTSSRTDGVGSKYCSRRCAEESRVRRGHNGVRDQVYALEGGVCQRCRIDARALFLAVKALRPAERLSALCDANWKLPRTGSSLERLLHRPREGDFWQADHIKAVVEGGGQCGLENLRTLCVPCHKAETEKLNARLRLVRGSFENGCESKVHSDGKKRNQLDIRCAFFGASADASPTSAPVKSKRRRRSAD